MTASEDAIWIIDDDTKMPFKFDATTGRFEAKGVTEGYRISAGLNGKAVMKGTNRRAYEWAEAAD